MLCLFVFPFAHFSIRCCNQRRNKFFLPGKLSVSRRCVNSRPMTFFIFIPPFSRKTLDLGVLPSKQWSWRKSYLVCTKVEYFLKFIINSYIKTIVAWLTPARICKDFSSQEEKASYLLRRHLKHNIDSFVRIFMAQFWSQSAREWGRFLILFSFLEAEILRHGPTTSFSPTDFIDTVVHIYS